MAAKVTFFPVDNGDMTLVELENGRQILMDINIRKPGDGIRDVAKDLRERLQKDAQGRPYVDAFLLSHPDQDHCRGLKEHFHLGPLSDYRMPKEGETGKIIIREMWSSPIVFRRAKRKADDHTLCEDAEAWATEARRRVNLFKKNRYATSGDRIQILGEDEGGKTDDIPEILVKVREKITKLDGTTERAFEALLIAPKPKGTEEEEETRSKNNSSVIINMAIAHYGNLDACRLLTGGDAEVAIWERIWDDHKGSPKDLSYDLLETPHHCSWHSLSWDSWSKMGEKVQVSEKARKALGQARSGAYIIATSKVITDDDSDPPCIRAQREYKAIAKEVGGQFKNTAIHPSSADPVPMVFAIGAGGVSLESTQKASRTAATVLGSQPVFHGDDTN